MVRCLMGGFTLKQSFELWKQKLQLFNPKTYGALRYVWYWSRIQCLKIALFFDKYQKDE